MTEQELIERLDSIRKDRKAAIRRMRKIYYGDNPCKEAPPEWETAYQAAYQLTEEYNRTAEQLDSVRGLR